MGYTQVEVHKRRRKRGLLGQIEAIKWKWAEWLQENLRIELKSNGLHQRGLVE